ncbi:MAG: DUF4402 domain-containing protein [Alphaproteobacteria bacterium]|nr:MAG: hypothetical protein B6I23_00165 [Rickettsiaceae bacterium 4572_127]
MKLLLLLFCLFPTLLFSAPITITETRALVYPTILPDQDGGTIEKHNWRQNIVNVAHFIDNGTTGRVRIKGDGGAEIEYEVLTGSLSGPGATINLHTGWENKIVTLPSWGRVTGSVGSELDYSAGQTSGIYNGSIQVRARYTSGDTTWVYQTISASIEITAQIILLTENKVMNFGKITPDPAGGTVKLYNWNSTIINTVGNSLFHGDQQVGVFVVKGQPNTPVFVSFSSGPLTGPGADLTLHDLYSNNNNPTLGSTGSSLVRVYGELDIPASATAGTYTGDYNIVVNY